VVVVGVAASNVPFIENIAIILAKRAINLSRQEVLSLLGLQYLLRQVQVFQIQIILIQWVVLGIDLIILVEFIVNGTPLDHFNEVRIRLLIQISNLLKLIGLAFVYFAEIHILHLVRVHQVFLQAELGTFHLVLQDVGMLDDLSVKLNKL